MLAPNVSTSRSATLRHGGFHSSLRLDQPGTATRSDRIEADGATFQVGQDEHHVRMVAIVRLAVQLRAIARRRLAPKPGLDLDSTG